MGHREGRHALHALVPTALRHHVREARQLPRPGERRPRHHELLRQGAHLGRVRRVQLPLRRPARHVRGARLHGVGSHELCVREGRGAVHPHRLLLLHRRGARQEDAASAIHERRRGAGEPRARAVRLGAAARRAHGGRRAGVLPHLREGLRQAPGSRDVRSHAVRLRPVQGPGAGGALFRRHPPHGERVHERARRRAVGARRARAHEAQRGGSCAARAGTHLHECEPRRGREPAHHGEDAPAGIALRPGVPAAREAVRGHQRLRQAQQLVAVRQQEPVRSGREPHGQPALPRVPHRGDPGGGRLPGAAAHVGGLRRQRPPPRRRRGAPGHRVHLPGRRAGCHRGRARGRP